MKGEMHCITVFFCILLHHEQEMLSGEDELVTKCFCASSKVESEDPEALWHDLKDFICKAHPHQDEKKAIITYTSIGLNGAILKKFLVNHGTCNILYFLF